MSSLQLLFSSAEIVKEILSSICSNTYFYFLTMHIGFLILKTINGLTVTYSFYNRKTVLTGSQPPLFLSDRNILKVI